ncbi:MAG TPA: lysozyme inhibitor LprI family protein [Allosphingosinicella sp.]|jgi:uncharacterized protein YecT (DUF1311 family)
MMLTLLLTLAAQAPGALTDAEVERLHTPAFRACMARGDARRGVTVAMLDCVDDEIRRHDELLNARYRRIMTALPAPRRESLRRLQRAWIGRRDRICGSTGGGGTADTLSAQECFLRETISRSEWLRSRYLRAAP